MAAPNRDLALQMYSELAGTYDRLIERHIGPEERLIGMDLSPEMLSAAAARAGRHGWTNVTLVAGAIEDAEIPAQADASLFVLTHDVMRSALPSRTSPVTRSPVVAWQRPARSGRRRGRFPSTRTCGAGPQSRRAT